MKNFWLLCLCLASLSLVGCFHVPDEDWLPSKNNAETWNIQKDEEMEQVLNSLMQWFDIISSDWNELKNEENEETISEEVENIEAEWDSETNPAKKIDGVERYDEPKRKDNVDKYENTENIQEDVISEE